MRLGILGGIGPEATGYLYSTVMHRLKKTGRIKHNTDYPHIMLNSISAPELTSLNFNPTMLHPYIGGIKELAAWRPDCIVMACNTIHLYRDILMKESGYTNIISLPALVKNRLIQSPSPICIVGTPLTITDGLYHFPECTYRNPNETDRNEIGNIIDDYNLRGELEKNQTRLIKIVEQQKQNGAKTIVAACTEISELLHGVTLPDTTLVDTLEILIEYLVQKCTP